MSYSEYGLTLHDYDVTFLTNFQDHMLPAYEAAIEKFPECRFEIKDAAISGFGDVLPGYKALHVYGQEDLSQFWRELDKIREKLNLNY